MKPEIDYVYNKLKKLRFDFNAIDFRDFRSEYHYDPELNRYVRKDNNDLFIDKNTFKPLEEELEYADRCHNLEEQLGCPLDVRERALKTFYWEYLENDENIKNYYVYAFNNEFLYVCYTCDEDGTLTTKQTIFPLQYYKKYWWLKKDKSE